MPFLGIGLHILVALFFAVHVVRSGREMYWLLILFMFPMLGSIVYFVAVYLPQSQIQRKVNRTVSGMAKSLDPGRELREAQAAFDMTPTAQNQIRLAHALLDTGETEQAIQKFDSCLKGPFARDPEIRFGAAKARLQNNEAQKAIDHLLSIREEHPSYMEEKLALQLANAYSLAGNQDAAQAELRWSNEKFGSLESKVEYAIWAHKNGQADLAQTLRQEIAKTVKHMPKHARTLNKSLLNRLHSIAGTS